MNEEQSHRDSDRPKRQPPACLTATGRRGLPGSIAIDNASYELRRVFKNDFFAATALYEVGGGGRVLLKIHRTAWLFGIPLRWIGRLLARREWTALNRLIDVPGVPRPIQRLGPTGIIREFIEGQPLRRGLSVRDDFHDRLRLLVGVMHDRGMAYVDLEKCENVLVGEDGAPYLFDFQIAWLWPAGWGGDRWPLRAIRKRLQSGDLYHLTKLMRRTRPDLMSAEEIAASYRKPWYVRVHNRLTRPLTLIRRRILDRIAPRATRGERGRVSSDVAESS